MKNIILLIIFKTIFFTAFSQKITDAFYSDFRKSVIDYLANIQKNRMDTLIVIFDCKAVAFEKSFHSGGANFTIRKDSCRNVGFDISKLKAKNVLVTSTSTFDFYLNFILASENSEKPGPGNVKGSYAYVYMPVEEWQQFYLDYLLGYKTIYLNPVIDIFRFNEGYVNHLRHKLTFSLKANAGFTLSEVKVIRRKKFQISEKLQH